MCMVDELIKSLRLTLKQMLRVIDESTANKEQLKNNIRSQLDINNFVTEDLKKLFNKDKHLRALLDKHVNKTTLKMENIDKKIHSLEADLEFLQEQVVDLG